MLTGFIILYTMSDADARREDSSHLHIYVVHQNGFLDASTCSGGKSIAGFDGTCFWPLANLLQAPEETDSSLRSNNKGWIIERVFAGAFTLFFNLGGGEAAPEERCARMASAATAVRFDRRIP